jgi:CDP-diacylglycerol---serine O-phosphatidyltransferase
MLRTFRPRPPGARRRGVYLLPSMFTLGNMFCGYACVVYAMRGEFETAAIFIGVAMVLDTLDGWIARLANASTDFGVQFDSLADVISFGIAPAVLAFAWGLASLGRLGWAAGFIFVTAAALRLARFNVQHATGDKRYFVGMPSPAAASVIAATVFAFPEPLQDYAEALPALAMVLVPALLMVSTVRFRSFKSIDLARRRPYFNLFVIAVLVAAIVSRPKIVLIVLSYSYLASALAGVAIHRLRRRGAPAAEDPSESPAGSRLSEEHRHPGSVG